MVTLGRIMGGNKNLGILQEEEDLRQEYTCWLESSNKDLQLFPVGTETSSVPLQVGKDDILGMVLKEAPEWAFPALTAPLVKEEMTRVCRTV